MNEALDVIERRNKKVGRKALAKLTGWRESTLKFYSEQGLLPFHQADEGLARRYDLKEVLPRLRDIKRLQRMGFDIEQIKERLVR